MKLRTAMCFALALNGVVFTDALAKNPAKFDTPLAPIVAPSAQNVQGNRPTNSTFEKAAEVDLLPLTLLRSKKDEQLDRQLELDQESKQIGQLWSATLDRSPDIQFVIHMLQADGSPRATATAMRYVGGAMFNIARVAPSMFTGGLARVGTGAAASMLEGLFNKPGTKQALPQERIVYLYGLVRRSADDLVDAYRAYKVAMTKRDLAQQNLDEVKQLADIASGADGNSASAATYRQYSILHAARDVRESDLEVIVQRKKLVDLAGQEAVAQLDGEFIAQGNLLKDVTGQPDFHAPLAVPEVRNAGKPRILVSP